LRIIWIINGRNEGTINVWEQWGHATYWEYLMEMKELAVEK
jgi:hypothetical protein